MIYDQLANLTKYQGIHPNLKTVIEFLDQVDSDSLVMGRNDISGEDVFLMLQENELSETFTGHYEYHKKYLDLHITVEGEETMVYGFDKNLEIKPYDAKDDYGLVTCLQKETFLIPENHFVLFLPGEAHEPSKVTLNSKKVKKYVVKIAI